MSTLVQWAGIGALLLARLQVVNRLVKMEDLEQYKSEMTDSNDTGHEKSAKGRSKRLRTHIYGERVTVSLRMDPLLHERMMDLCDELATPANTYVVGLIEADLKKRHDAI